MIHCQYENQSFPDNQFIHHQNGTILRPYIHDRNPLHFAEGGVIFSSPSPSQSSSSSSQSSSSSRPSSSPGPASSGSRDRSFFDPLRDKDWGSTGDRPVMLRTTLSLQLFLLAQSMPIEKLQALVNNLINQNDE